MKWGREVYGLWDHIPEIILDLIEKDKRGEFIGEGTNGAHFWGGHLYMDTVSEITGKPMGDLWGLINQMLADKQIQLEGCVIQSYYEPPAPSWSEYGRFEHEGYTGIAELPDHGKMEQEWKIAILGPDGKLVSEGIQGPRLNYSPDFGVDGEDVATVEAAIKQVIEQYLWDPMSQS
jgi:hypothetical protein